MLDSIRFRINEESGESPITDLENIACICPHCSESSVFRYTFKRWSRMAAAWVDNYGFYCDECERFLSSDSLLDYEGD